MPVHRVRHGDRGDFCRLMADMVREAVRRQRHEVAIHLTADGAYVVFDADGDHPVGFTTGEARSHLDWVRSDKLATVVFGTDEITTRPLLDSLDEVITEAESRSATRH